MGACRGACIDAAKWTAQHVIREILPACLCVIGNSEHKTCRDIVGVCRVDVRFTCPSTTRLAMQSERPPRSVRAVTSPWPWPFTSDVLGRRHRRGTTLKRERPDTDHPTTQNHKRSAQQATERVTIKSLGLFGGHGFGCFLKYNFQNLHET